VHHEPLPECWTKPCLPAQQALGAAQVCWPVEIEVARQHLVAGSGLLQCANRFFQHTRAAPGNSSEQLREESPRTKHVVTAVIGRSQNHIGVFQRTKSFAEALGANPSRIGAHGQHAVRTLPENPAERARQSLPQVTTALRA
jgi:hypothetical protein